MYEKKVETRIGYEFQKLVDSYETNPEPIDLMQHEVWQMLE